MRRRELLQYLSAVPAVGMLQACGGSSSGSDDGGSSGTRGEGEQTPTAAPSRKLERFGLQLSTITPLLMADFEGTLKQVSEIGYKQVEFSALGLLGRPVAVVKQLLADNNLEAPVGRISPKLPEGFAGLSRQEQMAAFRSLGGPDQLITNVHYGLEIAAELGQKQLNLPALMADNFQTLAGVEASIDLLRQAGEVCAKAGVQFGYHNHDWEFAPVEGVVPYDLMIEKIEPELMAYQLDVYWVTKAGRDPLEYLANFPGRFPSTHLKDMDVDGDFADVGDGEIDMPAFVAAAEASGTQYHFVERDGPPEPLKTAQRSYAYLSEMRY